MPIDSESETVDVDRRYLRKLALQTIGGVTVVMVALGSLAYFFREPLTRFSRGFVDIFGPPGIGLGFGLPDAFTLSAPPDTFLAVGLLAGVPFWEIVLYASIGSLVGGTIAYYIGRSLKRTKPFRRFMDRHGREAEELTRRYGTYALAIAALTPVPYSIMSYVTGAGGMGYSRFILVSLLRIPRVAGYLWLLELGVMPSVA